MNPHVRLVLTLVLLSALSGCATLDQIDPDLLVHRLNASP